MMGRGAEGGTHQIPRILSVYGSSQQKVHNRGWGVDIYSQALKALALKSPFRDEHEHVGIGALPLLDDPLSLKISSSVDNRRKNRAKKTQARGREGGPTSKKRDYVDDAAGDSTPGQFWMQMDDYFREVTTLDIQLLLPTTFPLFDSAGRVSDSCLLIPALGRHYLDTWAEEDANQAENVSQQFVKGVKRKILATSPVSKKSKKMSGEVVTTVISPLPDHEDEEELCHVCNGGDSDEMNQILFCDICNVAVHQDCYGVRQVPEGQWLCSWCSRKVMRKADNDPRECVLCPGRGGALKPVAEAESKGGVSKKGMKFAHLFCCQWVPETYIGNMEAMEPIRNVEGVRDERRRLLCSVCKEKQGACIQCSHGLCATAFHPLCAREAKLWMEVSSREDSEEVDLRAYCPKHTSARKGKAFVSGVEGSEGGSTQMKSPGDEDIKKASDRTIPTPAGFPSDVKTYVTGKGTKHAVSPHDTVVSPATEQQSADLENGVLHPLAVSRNPDKEQSQEPNVTSRSVEKVMGSRGLELSGDGNCIIGAEQSGIGIHSVSQVPNPGGDGVNAVDQKDKNLPELGHNLTVSGARKGKVTDSGGKGISRKCRRQSALRSDIGKLSIANGNKVVRLQADANSQGSRPEVESEEVASDEMAAVTGRGEFDTKPNEDAPVLPTSGAQKEDGAKTCSQDAALEAYEDTSKHQVQQDIDMKVGGCGASGLESKRVFVSQKAPTAHVHPYLQQRLKDYQPSCDTAEDISLSGEDDHFNCKVNSVLEHCILIPELSANLNVAEDALEQLEREVVVSEVGAKETWGSLERQWEQLQAAQSGGLLKFVPDDEIECEILVLQDKLLSCAQVNRVHCERVIQKVIPHVAEERAVSRRHGQDLAVVQYYLSQAREAKKQGRKEKREKEAQAVVAAATAAAAASPRVGYVKRDASVFDTGMGIMPQEIAGSSPGLLPNSLRHLKPPVPKPPRLVVQPTGHPTNSARSAAQIKSTSLKPTALTRIAVLRTGAQQSQLQEGSSLCDVCHIGLSSRLNKIVTCDQCKVAVHQDCYGIACIPLGVWRCQPCAELQRQYQNVTSPDLEAQAQQWVRCAICAGQGGALKCTTDGRWVHVFCALWMPETIVGKDESATIQGMENVPSERYALLCSICHQQEGACLTCNFGHCHGAFHPSCARQSGLFMNIKASSGGRVHYRAYCEKHSPQQRAKAELKQRSGYDHMHTLRQIRVELERVRLICERICRRERLKRDVMQSNKEVYLSQLQCAWQTAFGDMEQPQVSEQSWMNGNTVTFPQGSPDSLCGPSFEKHQFFCFAHRYISWNVEVSLATMQEMAASQRDQSADKKARDETKEHSKKHKKYKHADTKLHREKLMTPTEASMQNMRLPKGYAYVPVDVYVKGTMAAPHPDELEKGHLATSVPSHLP
ncbi:unnamed protein product [Sphagnum jensenii]|uniref:PHD finger protein n=1 Tax=Sphagnum jensenii TaxID=128206 RepID=A0ABP0W5I8_9BRYO